MTVNPLVLKLSSFMSVSEDEGVQIEAWCSNPTTFTTSKVLVHEGEGAGPTCIILDGWGYRYKDSRPGGRQIVGFLLPGDVCDLHRFLLSAADHTLAVVSGTQAVIVPSRAIAEGLEHQPRLTQAFWWSTRVDEAIAREWMMNLGQRDAATRMAHLFCELYTRAAHVGRARDGRLILPFSQTELGDALGLTSVHINRTLRALREQDLATHRAGELTIPDVNRLMHFAGFDPSYLQLRQLA